LTLTDEKIRNTKPGPRQIKLSDNGGLFILITPNGGKHWRWKYRFQGKEKLLSFGSYTNVSLSEARALRDNAREMLSQGFDPSAIRKEEKAREKADCLGAESLPFPSVRILMDGMIEIWKGRNVMRFTQEEAKFITDLLAKTVR
jgi:hypothetical protein